MTGDEKVRAGWFPPSSFPFVRGGRVRWGDWVRGYWKIKLITAGGMRAGYGDIDGVGGPGPTSLY